MRRSDGAFFRAVAKLVSRGGQTAMIVIGLRMIFGARGRYAMLVLGLAFAVLLSTQQVAILLGVLERATGPLQNIGVADLWVVSRDTNSIDFLRDMHARQLMRVRSVSGVEWAEPMITYKTFVNLPDGEYFNMHLIGIDRSSRIGKPPEVLSGDLASLDLPDTVFLDVSDGKSLPPLLIGAFVHIGGRRARVVGTCRARGGLEGGRCCTLRSITSGVSFRRWSAVSA